MANVDRIDSDKTTGGVLTAYQSTNGLRSTVISRPVDSLVGVRKVANADLMRTKI